MQRVAQRVGVAGANLALPPLAEPVDRGVVEGHLGRDAADRPAGRAKPEAQLGLLARDHRGAEAADLGQGRDAHQGVAPALVRVADLAVPLHVTQAVVDGRVRVLLAPPPAHDREARVRADRGERRREPRRRQEAVTVDQLRELQLRVVRAELLETGVAAARRGERGRVVQRHDRRTRAGRESGTGVGRTGVDVDDGRAHRQGSEAAAQPLALVPPDDDDTDLGRARRRVRNHRAKLTDLRSSAALFRDRVTLRY